MFSGVCGWAGRQAGGDRWCQRAENPYKFISSRTAICSGHNRISDSNLFTCCCHTRPLEKAAAPSICLSLQLQNARAALSLSLYLSNTPSIFIVLRADGALCLGGVLFLCNTHKAEKERDSLQHPLSHFSSVCCMQMKGHEQCRRRCLQTFSLWILHSNRLYTYSSWNLYK